MAKNVSSKKTNKANNRPNCLKITKKSQKVNLQPIVVVLFFVWQGFAVFFWRLVFVLLEYFCKIVNIKYSALLRHGLNLKICVFKQRAGIFNTLFVYVFSKCLTRFFFEQC